MMTSCTIRKLTKQDVKNAFHLRLEALEESPTSFLTTPAEERVKGEFFLTHVIDSQDNSSAILGAFTADDQLIGMLGIHKTHSERVKHKAYLWGTYVMPRHRAHGIGKKLLEHAVNFAKSEMSCDIARLSVVTENTPAIKLYQSAGFTIWGEEKSALIIDGKSYDEYHMALSLK